MEEPECKDSEDFDAGFGKCATYTKGRPNLVRCSVAGAALACPVSCGACCRDDPDFDAGWGNCTTYAPGGENAMWCLSDGAAEHCLVSCEMCESRTAMYTAISSDRYNTCVDDPFYDSGWGDCSTYAKGAANGEWCVKDGADVACPVTCGTCTAEAENTTSTHFNVVSPCSVHSSDDTMK